jgi:glycosyltransferase involved in cell wall biosynthesis
MRASVWDGASVLVRPVLDVGRYATSSGEHVTQVNLSDQKGGQMFQRLVRFMPDVQFLGVRGGYGKQRDLYGHNVTVMAPTERMRDEVYARSRVVVLPSRYETWGMVGPEAMCSGIPVVAAPTPGLRESLGWAGRFVDLKDLGGWLAAVRELVDDEAVWQVASEHARERAAELAAQDDRPAFVEALEGLC